jgi:hypothetical protein
VGCRRLAKVSVREIEDNASIAIVCPVEDIEDVNPELESDSFRNMCVFVEVDIRLVKIRPAERLRLLIPRS